MEIIFCSLTSLFISVSRQIYSPLCFSSEGLLPGCNLNSYHIFSCNCNIHFLLFRQLLQMLKWEIYSLHLFFAGNCPSSVATEVSCNRCFRIHCSYMTSRHIQAQSTSSVEAGSWVKAWESENQQLWDRDQDATGMLSIFNPKNSAQQVKPDFPYLELCSYS